MPVSVSHSSPVHPFINKYAKLPVSALYEDFREKNVLSENAKQRLFGRFFYKNNILFLFINSFINPFSIFLAVLGCISLVLHNVSGADMYHKNTALIVFVMLFLAGIIRFFLQLHIKKTMKELKGLSSFSCRVRQNGEWKKISADLLCPGTLISLHAGDIVPADCRIAESHSLYVSESALSGESILKEKNSCPVAELDKNRLSDYTNCLFKGSCIVSGNAKAFALAVNEDTVYGKLPLYPTKKRGFDKGVKSVARVFYLFMAVLVPFVFLITGICQGTWFTAFLFALSAAVGLVPEMLPMVITVCLVKGSFILAKKKAVVKNLHAMQALGQMDVLCIDKTGTLTDNKLILEYYLDILGNENKKVLDYACLTACYHNGIENPLDEALCESVLHNSESAFQELCSQYRKIEEVSLGTFSSAVTTCEEKDKLLFLAKGDAEEIFSHCSFYEYQNKIYPIKNNEYSNVLHVVREMQEEGMKVIAVAYKKISNSNTGSGIKADNLILLGYIGFFDAPKKEAFQAVADLKKLNTKIKVLTGDNLQTAVSVCKRLAIPTENALTGKDLEKLSARGQTAEIEKASLFAELTPKQKAYIVEQLQKNGHTVGYLGDGINDIPAILQADAGISNENAHVSLQNTADIILMKKDLSMVKDAILEGRKIFLQISKYIGITASSNLGNILSIVLAGIFLPFLPMTAMQILILNIAYDCLCFVLPWDNADYEQISRPRTWSGKKLGRFMLYFGSISTFFDCLTFAFLFFIFCPAVTGNEYFSAAYSEQRHFTLLFQSGWFLESLWTQTLILLLLRSPKIPFIQSSPSKIFFFVTVLGLGVLTILAYSPLAGFFSLQALPLDYTFFIIAIICIYLFTVSLAKTAYYKKYAELV